MSDYAKHLKSAPAIQEQVKSIELPRETREVKLLLVELELKSARLSRILASRHAGNITEYPID